MTENALVDRKWLEEKNSLTVIKTLLLHHTMSTGEMRKLAVMELFSPKKVQFFRHIREEETELMVKKVLESSALARCPVDLGKTFYSLTVSIIFRVAFKQNSRESDLIDQERVQELITEAVEALGDIRYRDLFPGGLGRFVDWLFGTHKRLNKVFKELDTFYQNVINDHLKESRRKTSNTSADIVSAMMDMIEKQGKDDYFKLDTDNIKAIIMNVFLAGTDTTARTMIWTMAELARNPRVMKKVQEDIQTILGTGKKIITEEDLNKVDYLQCIIKETFRLHPPAPLLHRQTMPHLKIQGYDIPPDTSVLVNVWAIGRDPEIWTDPEDFIPERFINSPVDFIGHDFDLLPFGSGRRICPGIPMSIATIELGLLNFLYFFDWKLPGGMVIEDIDMEEVGNLSVVKKLPLMLVPVQREV